MLCYWNFNAVLNKSNLLNMFVISIDQTSTIFYAHVICCADIATLSSAHVNYIIVSNV